MIDNVLFPGSPDAVVKGCICPVMDNHQGKGSGYGDHEGNNVYWMTADCPIHDGNAIEPVSDQ